VLGENIVWINAGVGNGGTLGCHLPRWKCCCGALEPHFEVLRVKTQFWLSGWETTKFVCRVLFGDVVMEA
jgi:hypothetical protein